jgi:hypothetical protein
MYRLATALATALVAAALAAPADAAPYSEAVNVTDPATDVVKADALAPVAAFAPDGAQTVVWVAGLAGDASRQMIMTASRAAGATAFTAPVAVTPAGRVASPSLAVGPDGTAAIVWLEYPTAGSGYLQVDVSVRAAGGSTWSAPTVISEPGLLSQPVVGIGESGAIAITWVKKLYSGFRVDGMTIAHEKLQDYASATTTVLNGGLLAISPRLAVGPDGTIAAAWLRRSGGVNRVYAATTRGGSIYFGGSQALSATGRGAGSLALGVGDGGAVTVAWRRDRDRVAAAGESSCSSYGVVQAASRLAGHRAFGGPETLSKTVRMNCGIAVTAAADGSATVVWSRYAGKTTVVEVAARAPGKIRYRATVRLSTAGHRAYAPAVAATPDGTTTVVWLQSDGGLRVRAATRGPADVRFGTSVPVSGVVTEPTPPRVVAGLDRNLIVWRAVTAAKRLVQAVMTVPR